jgi:hypothetical protein
LAKRPFPYHTIFEKFFQPGRENENHILYVTSAKTCYDAGGREVPKVFCRLSDPDVDPMIVRRRMVFDGFKKEEKLCSI